MITKDIKIRVRYGETDQMGYLYYGNYALYYEVGRVETLRDYGIVYKEVEEKGTFMPVTHMKSRYLRPARYDDLITVTTTIEKYPEREIIFDFKLYNDEGKLLNTGQVVLAYVSSKTGKRIDIPTFIDQKLSGCFGKESE